MLLQYYKANKTTGSVILYLIFSAILKATVGVDVCIPCLWKLLFHLECPGCGMTTAFTHLLVLDFEKAYEANRLIFILLPSAMGFLYVDFVKFRRAKV